ncbi:hypothetical protein T4B_11321 [Trichinella pseudospiralis]|uniref:Uncharacterized protein n=1 Tax=Trichinella pseudospiralis TaxID=6337 RepID=A0A0V1EBB9_TRIPS|nr:hypothetical protein T4A_11313 [Trichinella pseudospiralis]KRZ29396.1 hypothetical protein T4B_11321 [Trichinella pseudospiralis]KRZ38521.1 hypothetical protein T4C_1747 [Trichinella pseudospiralis]
MINKLRISRIVSTYHRSRGCRQNNCVDKTGLNCDSFHNQELKQKLRPDKPCNRGLQNLKCWDVGSRGSLVPVLQAEVASGH